MLETTDIKEPTLISRDSTIASKEQLEGRTDLKIAKSSIEKPDRAESVIDETLRSLSEGDRIKVTMGVDELTVTLETTVVNIRNARADIAPFLGWTYSIEFLGAEGENDVTRIYRTGVGGSNDPWRVYNYRHTKGIDLTEDDTERFGGWIISITKLNL